MPTSLVTQPIGRIQVTSSNSTGGAISQQAMLLGNSSPTGSQAQMYLRTQMVSSYSLKALCSSSSLVFASFHWLDLIRLLLLSSRCCDIVSKSVVDSYSCRHCSCRSTWSDCCEFNVLSFSIITGETEYDEKDLVIFYTLQNSFIFIVVAVWIN